MSERRTAMTPEIQPWPEVIGILSKEHTDVRALLSGVAEAAGRGDATGAARQINAGRGGALPRE